MPSRAAVRRDGSQGGGGAHGGSLGDDDNAASRPSGGRAAGWRSTGYTLRLLAGTEQPEVADRAGGGGRGQRRVDPQRLADRALPVGRTVPAEHGDQRLPAQ